MQSFFVSSTFKDMQGERDALHRIVMPRLRELAAKNGENIQFVDLRWGISTADMDSKESSSKILSICLREVQNCKPYMIILLGQRYGWIPPMNQIREAGAQMNFTPEDLNISVTELEIRFGMYVARGQLDHCIFCLRDPLEEAALTSEQKEIYLPTNDEDSRRMAALRKKIKNTPGAHVLTYKLDCDSGNLTGYEDFSERLYSALAETLAPRWANRKHISWQQRQREEDTLISENHLNNFVERKDTLQLVLNAVRYSQVVMLVGEGGCGKSAIMAKLNQIYQHSNHSIVIFCGTSSNCMSVQQIMQLMLWWLDIIQGNVCTDVKDDQLQEIFRERMKSYSGPTCIFLLDAIDQLVPDQDLFESRFLPPEISSSIRIIVSTTGTVQVNPATLTGITFRKIQLEAPSETELRTILHSRFASEHKQISQKVADKILENPCSKNMLGMEIMVRRLVMLGQKDFDEISRLEQTMGGAEAIDTYLIQLIENFSSELNELIIDYFFDVSHFLDKEDFTRSPMLLYLIGIMQHGITPQELEDLSHYLHTSKVFSNIPEEHPWMHFWNPVVFARLKRFMGGLLVERSNGNIDFSHRLLRQALRTTTAFSIIAPILRCWLITLPDENLQKLENILPISRLAEEDNRRSYKDQEYTQQEDLIDLYFSDPICNAGKLDNDGDPEGARRLAILERSVIQDITGEDQKVVAEAYCNILRFIIQKKAGPDHYIVWFFGSRISKSLSCLGQEEKARTLQIMCCILSHLHKQKELFESGEERFRENWTNKRKRRFLAFHCNTLQMMADLMMDFRLDNVEVHYFDDMSPDVIFEKGCALADECIREDPTFSVFYLRKAALYAAYAKQTSPGTNPGFTKSKQQIYTQEAFRCIQQAFRLEVTDVFREYALYIISICVESICLDGKSRLFGGKKLLDFGIEMCQKIWDLVTTTGDIQKLPVVCVARFKLAWSRCLDTRSNLIMFRESEPWRQQALELCAEYYLDIRNQEDRVLSQSDRKYLSLVGVQVCEMMLYGITSKAMNDAGYNRTMAFRYIANHEAGYIRAQARRDFLSRWHWALMLCAEVYAGTLTAKAGLESMEQAVAMLEELHKIADTNAYSIDVPITHIDAILEIAKHLHNLYAENVEND